MENFVGPLDGDDIKKQDNAMYTVSTMARNECRITLLYGVRRQYDDVVADVSDEDEGVRLTVVDSIAGSSSSAKAIILL